MAIVKNNSPDGTFGWFRSVFGYATQLQKIHGAWCTPQENRVIEYPGVIFETEMEAVNGRAKKSRKKIRKNGKTRAEMTHKEESLFVPHDMFQFLSKN